MRNPYAAPEPPDTAIRWWLLLVVVAALTLVFVVSLGKDRTPGGHLAPVVSIDSNRTLFSR